MVKLLITLALAGCIFTAQARDVYPSTYQAPEVPDLLIINASLYVGDGSEIGKGFVHVRQGQIVAVGAGSPVGIESTWVIDAEGKWVTPGIIDVHSHLGNYPSPRYRGSRSLGRAQCLATGPPVSISACRRCNHPAGIAGIS